MKPDAVVFAIPLATAPGYCWRWRAADGKTDSKKAFVFYYDCLADAEASGYSVRPEEPHGETAPSRGSLPPAALR